MWQGAVKFTTTNKKDPSGFEKPSDVTRVQFPGSGRTRVGRIINKIALSKMVKRKPRFATSVWGPIPDNWFAIRATKYTNL